MAFQGNSKIGWMGFFILMIVVVIFGFLIIGMNSENAVQKRSQVSIDSDDSTEATAYGDYINETQEQTRKVDLTFIKGLEIFMVFAIICIGIVMMVRMFVKKGRGGGGMS